MYESLALFAATTADAHVRYGSSRLQSFSEWWQLPVLILTCLLVMAFVVFMYRRDSVELRPGVGLLLMFLRLTALAGLLLFFLGVERRSERKIVNNSRVLMLVDTSMSMTRQDATAASGSSTSRIQQVIDELEQTDLLTRLRKTHDVSVWRFDKELAQVVSLDKVANGTDAARVAAASVDSDEVEQARPWRLAVLIGAGVFVLSVLGFLTEWYGSRRPTFNPMWLAAGVLGVGVSVGSAAYLDLSRPHSDLLVLLGLRDRSPAAEAIKPEAPPAQDVERAAAEQKDIHWTEALNPEGTETRLGQSLRQLLNDERATPVAGVVVYSDGGQNAGIGVQAAIDLAREAKIPIYTVGLGSDQSPKNVRVSDLAAPARIYPGDGFQVTGYIQGEGFANRRVTVELLSRAPDKPGAAKGTGKLEATQFVTLGADGEVSPVHFDLPGITETGRRTLRLQIKPPAEDADNTDDAQEHDVEVVERKNHVLLLAGGPTREYQFLRNQLRRDKGTVVDVLLQSGVEGMSQDANKILLEFPRTKEELYSYDCIVAFDPDWQALDSPQIDLLERWVAEQAGGLVCIAGPVYMDAWTQDKRVAKIRGLYPVEFSNRLLVAAEGRFQNSEPSKVEFSRDGGEAAYLWLGDTAAVSQQAWDSFPGVFGHYGVRGAKPGATVMAYFGESAAGQKADQRPVYMAEQFYGAGRVFYLGSGEMWRLRSISEGYFEQFYTKLLRHVSQGRLMRGSARGVLLVEREKLPVGSGLAIRAQVNTAKMEPLEAPRVMLQVIQQKKNTVQSLALLPDPVRKGMYVGQFTPREEGTYRLELDLPDGNDEPLNKTIRAELVGVEGHSAPRNTKLLTELSQGTKGLYYPGIEATHGSADAPALDDQLQDRTETTVLAGDKDLDWDRRWMSWLLFGMCGLLCAEWLIRRLSKLA